MARHKLAIAVVMLSMISWAQEFSPTVPQTKACPGTQKFATYDAGTGLYTCAADVDTGITTLDTLTGTTQTFSKTDDTNVTLTLTPSGTDHNFALGWTGTLAKARQNAATVYTDAANVFTAVGQEIDQPSNSGTLLTLKRFTATSPTGKFFDIQNEIGGSLLAMTAAGAISSTITNVSLSLAGRFTLTGPAGVAWLTAAPDTASIDMFTSTVATSGANRNSPAMYIEGNYWDGAAPLYDAWTIQNVMGSGSNPTSTLTFAKGSGASSGVSSIKGVIFNATTGFRVNGAAGSGKYLKGDGTNLVLSTGSASGIGACGSNTFASTLNSDAAATCTAALTAKTATTSQYFTAVTAAGVFSAAQPAFSDISGSVATGQEPSAVVQNNIANAGTSAMKLNMSASTAIDSFRVPVVAGFVPTANGSMGYDSTANTYVGGVNTATKTFAMIDGNIATATALATNPSDCSANQFANAIAASGNLTCAQPAFTDISGTATAAQLPNPSSSTLGGIQSLASAASKWINTISTSGVPSATQPAFTDISGSVAAGQMPALTGDVTTSAGGVATTLAHLYNEQMGTPTALACTGGGGTTTFVGEGNSSTTEATVSKWTATEAFTVTKLYVQLGGNVPASQSAAVTVMMKTTGAGAGSAQTVTCSVGAAASACNDTAHSFNVTAGNTLYLRVVCSGGTTALTPAVSAGVGYK